MVGLDIKPHQVEGHKWCTQREKSPTLAGGVICDEMGLGKTILMLGSILFNTKKTLIVVPPCLVNQWEKCISKYLFNHKVYVFHGAKSKISMSKLETLPIVLTTYGMVATRKKGYVSKLWKCKWGRIIFDEAHHMRNYKTNIFKGCMKMKSTIRWLITGTPIQNSYKDLRALFAVLGKIVQGENEMKECIKSLVLRRTKKGVGIKIPNLKKNTILVKWKSKAEKSLAASIHAMLPTFGVTNENVNEIIEWLDYESPLPLFVRARQVCIDHNLLHPCVEKLREEGVIPRDFVMRNIRTTSKITAIVKKVISQPKEIKKIIFCYYRGEIDILKERLTNANYKVAVIDGRSKKSEKKAACDPEENYDILLAQIQTASEGLNLQHFSQVYFTSPHWNPAVEDQAIARAHRIGQSKEVQTFHFEMEPFSKEGQSIDNYCMSVQKRKRDLMKILNQ